MSSLCKGKVSKGVFKHTKYLLSLFRKWLHCNFCFFSRGGIHKTFWLKEKSSDRLWIPVQCAYSLYCTANERAGGYPIYKCLVPIYVVPEMNCYFQNRIIMFCLPVPTIIFLWEVYIFPGSVCLFCCTEICGPILGIYKSLTDTWMWKLGLRPRNSQKKNTGFSLQCVSNTEQQGAEKNISKGFYTFSHLFTQHVL